MSHAPKTLCALLLATGCQTDRIPPDGAWIDLTHEFSAETIYWPTASGFELTVDSKGMSEKGYWYEANSFRTAEHGGTHLDAPVHFARGHQPVEQVPLERLVGPAVVVDVSQAALGDRDFRLRVADLRAWEARHGRIPDGAIVLLRTGYGRFWPDRERYMGTAERGLQATFKLRFPGLHPAAAQWLVAERKIDAFGIDTPSIDYGKSRFFRSHQILFKADVPAFENVANLDRLPPKGAFVVALPMKIKGGSGAPLRIVALVPRP